MSRKLIIKSDSTHPLIMSWGRDGYKLKNGCVSVFINNWDLQEREGLMDFILGKDHSPDFIEVEAVYDMTKYASLFE